MIVTAPALLAGCTAVENDLRKGLRYGTESDSLMRKADTGKRPGKLPRGVNAYLWRAAMDSVGFLPLETADPRSGKIITGWFSAPSEPQARTRFIVEILHPDLRRDTIRATILRQVQSVDGAWQNTIAPAGTSQSLEDSIYAKANDLRAE